MADEKRKTADGVNGADDVKAPTAPDVPNTLEAPDMLLEPSGAMEVAGMLDASGAMMHANNRKTAKPAKATKPAESAGAAPAQSAVPKAEHSHTGHRKRMWARMMNDYKHSLKSYQDHELLELLLYYVYARENTNEYAHRLVETFGSLYNVMHAPYTGLLKVDRIGEKGAKLIKLCGEIAARCQLAEANFPRMTRITSPQDAVRYFHRVYLGVQQEMVSVAFLGNSGTILDDVQFPAGQVNATNLDLREIIQRAVNINAAAVVLAHNHPHGSATPSEADVEVTKKLTHILSYMHISMYDHIILGGGGTAFSMRESGNL